MVEKTDKKNKAVEIIQPYPYLSSTSPQNTVRWLTEITIGDNEEIRRTTISPCA